MSDHHSLRRSIPALVRTIGPFLLVIAITIVALVLYLELVALLVEILPELVG